jgi:excisionase family DNA binding protein
VQRPAQRHDEAAARRALVEMARHADAEVRALEVAREEALNHRAAALKQLRDLGVTYPELASIIGVTKARAQQIIRSRHGSPSSSTPKVNDRVPPALERLELLTAGEVAALLRVDGSTVRRWRHEAYGPAWVKVGGRCLYKRSDVERWLADAVRLSQGRQAVGRT